MKVAKQVDNQSTMHKETNVYPNVVEVVPFKKGINLKMSQTIDFNNFKEYFM